MVALLEDKLESVQLKNLLNLHMMDSESCANTFGAITVAGSGTQNIDAILGSDGNQVVASNQLNGNSNLLVGQLHIANINSLSASETGIVRIIAPLRIQRGDNIRIIRPHSMDVRVRLNGAGQVASCGPDASTPTTTDLHEALSCDDSPWVGNTATLREERQQMLNTVCSRVSFPAADLTPEQLSAQMNCDNSGSHDSQEFRRMCSEFFQTLNNIDSATACQELPTFPNGTSLPPVEYTTVDGAELPSGTTPVSGSGNLLNHSRTVCVGGNWMPLSSGVSVSATDFYH